MQVSQNYNNRLVFGGFYKVQGSNKNIKNLKNSFINKDNDFLTLSVKKDNKERVLYLFSGEDINTFLDLTKKVIFFDFRHNIEKYMPKIPENISIKEAKTLLNK